MQEATGTSRSAAAPSASTEDERFIEMRAVQDANQLLRDHGLSGDVEMIRKLADLVERATFTATPRLGAVVAAELRARAALVLTIRRNG